MSEDLVKQLDTLALKAETSKTYVQEFRMMRAEGVADIIYAAKFRIEELEADLRKMALDLIAADGQAAEAYQAQLAAEAQLADITAAYDTWPAPPSQK